MADNRKRAVSTILVNQVNDWLMDQALKDTDLETIILGACERVHAAGIPIMRGFFGFSVLHPLYSATSITWQRGNGTKIADYPHVPNGANEGYLKSPFYYMSQRGLDTMRVHLDCTQRQYDFPILKELMQQGLTDYLAFRMAFDRSGDRGMTGSWATDHRDGFSEEDIEALLRLNRRLAVASKIAVKSKLMTNLTSTYLGRGAGEHVLSGQIKRGDGQSIKAAIWFADIRGSTALADRLDSQGYIDVLNQFFDATGRSVIDKGGEILSFIGDGLLAIFPAKDSEESLRDASTRAMRAALKAETRLDRMNHKREQAGLDAIRFGIALHLGEVMFGNVGALDRLTFSAFGQAVNEVSRLDQLTKTLKENMVASDEVASRIDHPVRALGAHSLRGVGEPMHVFAPLRKAANDRRKPRRPSEAAE